MILIYLYLNLKIIFISSTYNFVVNAGKPLPSLIWFLGDEIVDDSYQVISHPIPPGREGAADDTHHLTFHPTWGGDILCVNDRIVKRPLGGINELQTKSPVYLYVIIMNVNIYHSDFLTSNLLNTFMGA